MAYNHEWPYSDLGRANSDWLINKVKELIREMAEFTGYNDIRFADPIEWSPTTYYKRFTIVLYEDGNSYISKKDVPVGIPPLEEDYWQKIGDFNAQLESYYNQFNALNAHTTPEAFGAVGDGLTDDTAAIQSAINSGNPVVFKAGKTYVTGKITIDSDSYIDLNGAKLIGKNTIIFDCKGTEAGTTTLAADYHAGDKFIELNDTSNIKVGDLLFIHDDNNVFYTAENTDFYASGVVEVTTIGPAGVGIFPTIPFDLYRVSAQAVVYNPISVTIKNGAGFKFNDTYTSAIYLTGCKNSVISGLHDTENNLNCCIATSHCLNTVISECVLESAEPTTPNYIISNGGGSYNTKIVNCNILSTWHSFSNNGVYAICNTIVDKCLFKASTANAAYRDHGCGIHTTIRDTVLNGAVFSNDAIMENCRVLERDNGGVGEIIIQISDVRKPSFYFNNVEIEGIYARINAVRVSDVSSGGIEDIVLRNVSAPNAAHLLIVAKELEINRIVEDGKYASVENIDSTCKVNKLLITNADIDEFFGLGASDMQDVAIVHCKITGRAGTSLNAVCDKFTMDDVFITAPDVRPSFRLKAELNVLNNVIVDTPTGYAQGKIELDAGKKLYISNSSFCTGTYAAGTVVNAVNCEINGSAEYSEIKYQNSDQKLYYVHLTGGSVVATALN